MEGQGREEKGRIVVGKWDGDWMAGWVASWIFGVLGFWNVKSL